ncbi:MAG: 30S ribosomal protein S3 [Candidatus Aenigmarchaeota archaeon]|nr:30S ribosomal protein S3 [Candidatus Aenigmarchaeota archaeon]
MALEKKFVKEGIRNKDLEGFLTSEFDRAGYSHSIIQRTPLSIRITIFARRPGLIIGRGGKNIEMITRVLKEKFGFENPQLDVQEIENPDIDAHIIAKWIASSIERGLNFKRVANIALERVMGAGAAGVALRISGKLGGDMGRTEKFNAGYLNYSGDPAETMVDKAYAQANVKLGMIGIQVRIMRELPRELTVVKKVFVEEEAPVASEEKKAVEEQDVAEEKTDEKEAVEKKAVSEKKQAPKEETKPKEKKEKKQSKEKKTEQKKKAKVEDNGDNKEKATK